MIHLNKKERLDEVLTWLGCIIYFMNIFTFIIYLVIQWLIEEPNKLSIGPLPKINLLFFYDS